MLLKYRRNWLCDAGSCSLLLPQKPARSCQQGSFWEYWLGCCHLAAGHPLFLLAWCCVQAQCSARAVCSTCCVPNSLSQTAISAGRAACKGHCCWFLGSLFILRSCSHSRDGAGDKQCALCAPGNMTVKVHCSRAVLDGWWLQGFLVTAWNEQEGNPLLSYKIT